jgi:Predicted N-acetylglucosamine kinase
MKYFIGADQGGSKTDVLISDENGNIIDRQTGYGYCSFLKELHDKSEFVVKYIEQQVTILENILNKNSIDICDVCVLTACMATVNDNNKRDYEEEIRKKNSNSKYNSL